MIERFYAKITTLCLIFAFLVAGLIFLLTQSPPRILDIQTVRSFASAPKQIVITFNHTMDRRSVEKNFALTPAINGKFSWSGRRVAFTADDIFPYEQNFTVTIGKDATDEQNVHLADDFHFRFVTPPLRFFYIGQDGAEKDRLVSSDKDGQNRQILSDPGLKVDEFKVSDDGHRLYFLASTQDVLNYPLNQLYQYRVDTKTTTQLTHDTQFLNRDFFVAPPNDSHSDQAIILTRIPITPQNTLGQTNFWMGTTRDFLFQPLSTLKISDSQFAFSPDGSYVLYHNDAGQFQLHALYDRAIADSLLGDFDQNYGFHPFLPLMAFTRYDYSNVFSLANFLMLFSGDGTQTTVPTPPGLVKRTIFTPDGQGLVMMISRQEDTFDRNGDSAYPLRIFHLYFYDLKTKTLRALTSDMTYSEQNQAISPDSRFLYFERYQTSSGNFPLDIDADTRDVASDVANAPISGAIWSLKISDGTLTNLGINGHNIVFAP